MYCPTCVGVSASPCVMLVDRPSQWHQLSVLLGNDYNNTHALREQTEAHWLRKADSVKRKAIFDDVNYIICIEAFDWLRRTPVVEYQ